MSVPCFHHWMTRLALLAAALLLAVPTAGRMLAPGHLTPAAASVCLQGIAPPACPSVTDREHHPAPDHARHRAAGPDGQDLDTSPGFATLALNAGYRISDTVQLTAGVDNVFDRTYSEHLNLAGNADFGYPADPVRIHEPGRTAWVKLNLSW